VSVRDIIEVAITWILIFSVFGLSNGLSKGANERRYSSGCLYIKQQTTKRLITINGMKYEAQGLIEKDQHEAWYCPMKIME
jgi:hypothetical protein